MTTAAANPATAPVNRVLENGMVAHAGLLDQVIEQTPSVYDKISDPLVYVEKMGEAYAKAGVAGCTKPAEGVCLAWALMEMRMNWIQFASEYHMVQGKPTLQAHVILARIRKAGGDVEWINDGDALIEARAKFTINGRTSEIAYSMATAKLAGVVKKDSGWEKNPAAMLRAAMMRKGSKMLCPEVLTGDVDPEEFVGVDEPKTEKPARAKADIDKRREELQKEAVVAAAESGQTAPVTTAAPVTATTETVAGETTPFEAPTLELPAGDAARDMTATLMEIELTIEQAGMTKAQLEAGLKAKNPSFTTLDDLPLDKMKALLENVRAHLAKK